MTVEAKKIEELITTNIESARVEVKDLVGDGNHYAVNIISSQFIGKSRLQRHRMVYDALEGLMDEKLHALQITTAES